MTISDMPGNTYLVECIGCAIGRGEVEPPGGILKATEHFILHQDPEIAIPGFLIAASKEHVQSVAQLGRTERHELIDLVHDAVSALKEAGIAERITLIQEERSRHFHMWLFPHYEWMEPYFPSAVPAYREVLKAVKERPQDDETVREILDAAAAVRMKLEETEK